MIYVPRKLWYQKPRDDQRTIVAEDDLPGLSKAIVVLGEPGMGKTELLRRLAKIEGTASCTAGKLINTHDPARLIGNATTLIIDALDEVAANREGAAVDRVVQKLGAVGNPPFILSCRVADWQAATSAQTIEEMYGEDPLIVHLLPLERDDQIAILADEVGVARSEELLAHFEAFDLDLLGNPQTLLMIARLSAEEALPTTKGDLFEKAVDRLWCEHREGRGATELDRETALDAAGAAFATLILTGSSTIVRHGAAHVGEGELAFAEVDRLAGGNLARILGSRLFEGGEDSFTYWHRRIGEFLGARWLAKRANEPAKRRRLLHLFQSHGLVPASLRGLHAWLARDPKLAPVVIAADPMGVIEYGDADALTQDQARQLLCALRRIPSDNPMFRLWRGESSRARALASSALHREITAVLRDPTAPTDLRTLILEQFADERAAAPHRDTLRQLLLDRDEVYIIRDLAANALTRLGGEEWPSLLEELRQQGAYSSTNIAFKLIQENGIDNLTDTQVIEVLLANERLTLVAVPEEKGRIAWGGTWSRFPESTPPERIDGLLNVLSEYMRELLPPYIHSFTEIDKYEGLRLFAHCSVMDRISTRKVGLTDFLNWIISCQLYPRDYIGRVNAVSEWIQTHDDIRVALLREVLFDRSEQAGWMTERGLTYKSPGLEPSEDDIVNLLGTLDPRVHGSLSWPELLELIPHDEERGRAARAAALPFAACDPALRDWLASLAGPKTTAENESTQNANTAVRRRHTEHKIKYTLEIDRIRKGLYEPLFRAARAYMKHYSDVGQQCLAHERIAEWLGWELAAAAHEGFESYLVNNNLHPSAAKVFDDTFIENSKYSGNIIIAALAERLRLNASIFDRVSNNALLLALYAFWSSGLDAKNEFNVLLHQVETEVRRRSLWEQAHRQFIVPQLKRGWRYVGRLQELMYSGREAVMVTALVVEWLWQCPELDAELECEMIDYVIQSARRDELCTIGERKRKMWLDTNSRRNWDAVAILLDFESTRDRMDGALEPDLLWHIRDLSGCNKQENYGIRERLMVATSPMQAKWIVEKFRYNWPYSEGHFSYSDGLRPWHASTYLKNLIVFLGLNTSREATQALEALRDMPEDGYTDSVKLSLAAQHRRRVEQAYIPPKVADIGAIVDAGPPRTASDLQAVMLETLAIAQKQLKGDDVDWYRGFYREDGRHKNEEPCRDELIKMLRAIDGTLEYIPEPHVADDKRVDIVARVDSQPILPIEIKGTWHDKLWTAADEQLNHQYVEDWRAERGIYLVLWFGVGTRIATPPAGIAAPTTPEDLRRTLVATSRAARNGDVDVVVLDLTRPTAA